MAQEWDIRPRGSGCSGCQTPFEDRQPCVSALVFGEQGYTRGDYCSRCWEKSEKLAVPYSTWRGVFRSPAPPPAEPLRKETAESLLRRLIEDGEASTQNVRFILAVMLERKRVLVERDAQLQGDGTLVRVYEHRRTGETFVINDPRLGLDQIESVQQEVMALLGAPEPAPGGQTPTEAKPVAESAEPPAPAQPQG